MSRARCGPHQPHNDRQLACCWTCCNDSLTLTLFFPSGFTQLPEISLQFPRPPPHPQGSPLASPYILDFHLAGIQLHVLLLLKYPVNDGAQDSVQIPHPCHLGATASRVGPASHLQLPALSPRSWPPSHRLPAVATQGRIWHTQGKAAQQTAAT